MGADVVEVGVIGQGVLGDDVDVAAVEAGIQPVLGRRERLGEDHVGGAEATRIGPAVEHGMRRHGRVKRDAVGVFGGLAVAGVAAGLEHVMSEPVAEEMSPLLVVAPVREDRVERNEGEDGQDRCDANLLTVEEDPSGERQRQGQAQGARHSQDGEDRAQINIDQFVQVEGAGHGTAHQHPEADVALVVLGHQQGCHDRQPVAHRQRDDGVGRGEEDLHQLLGRLVDARVEEDQQQNGQTQVDGREADEPGPFAEAHLLEEGKGHETHEEVGPVEFFPGSLGVHPQLAEDHHRIGTRVGLFILAPGEGMDESLPSARVAPVHGRVRGRGDGHVQVEGGTQREGQPCDQHHMELVAEFASLRCQPKHGGQRSEAHQIVDHEHGQIALEGVDLAGEVGQQAQEPDDGVAQEEVPAQSLVGRCDGDFDAHGGHDQGLVIAQA